MFSIATLPRSTARFAKRSISSSTRPAKTLPFFPSSKDAAGTRNEEPFRMLMLAKPGAGKGTLSGRLIEKYDIKFLSTGDILRQHIKDKTEIGRTAETIVAQGGLLSDDLMIRLLASNMESLKGKNWIVDGFPRTLRQGELLDTYLESTSSPLSLIVHLDVPDEVILGRISDRWIHPGSGRIYNYSYNRPKVDGLDDVTGEPLAKRPDDNPEVFARRLQAFYNATSPLLAYYRSRSHSKLVSLAGKTSDEIWPQLERVIQSRFRLKPKSDTRSSASAQSRGVPEAVIRQATAGLSDSAESSMIAPIRN